MDHKPNFFERVLIGFLKKKYLFSEVFFWWLLFGIIGFIPSNDGILKVIGFALGIRFFSVILFVLPSYLIYLLTVGEKIDPKSIEPTPDIPF
jgi:hypothetical protein